MLKVDHKKENKKVLVAEKASIEAAYIKYILERKGWKAEIVSSGEDVLNKLENTSYKFILINSSLVDTDGLEVAKKIQEQEQKTKRYTPIIGISNYSLMEERKRFMAAGINHCLTKPIYKTTLFGLISSIVKEGDHTLA